MYKRLAVNIDHIATLRQARRERYPSPILAAQIAELAGADGIIAHLREDRRHIQDKDIEELKEVVLTKLNLEMAVTEEMISIAKKIKPHMVTFVPERRQEITTEGGLSIFKIEEKLKEYIKELKKEGILVSLFIEPSLDTIKKSKELQIDVIEIHTGSYANAKGERKLQELKKIQEAVKFAFELNFLYIAAGHGLDYHNVTEIAKIKEIEEYNIGFSIIARSLFVGLFEAVKEMKRLINQV